MTLRSIFSLIGAIALCQFAGIIGTLTTATGEGSWYTLLDKPAFTPPGWTFGVVWPILYTLMGIALWLVWRQGTAHENVRVGIVIFFAQLVVNAAWSLVFFGLQSPLGGLCVIIALLLLIALTMLAFARVSKTAAYLLVPYLAWVVFATVLNAAIWWLNR